MTLTAWFRRGKPKHARLPQPTDGDVAQPRNRAERRAQERALSNRERNAKKEARRKRQRGICIKDRHGQSSRIERGGLEHAQRLEAIRARKTDA